MNVLIYVPALTRRFGGVYQYTLALLHAFAESPIHYFIYCLEPSDEIRELCARTSNLHLLESRPQSAPSPRWRTLLRGLWVRCVNAVSRRTLKRALIHPPASFWEQLLRRHSIQITHCPYQDILKVDSIPAITTMHDVQELYFPQFFSSAERARRAVVHKQSIDDADAVVVSYQHIKADIVRFFEKDQDDVHVVFIGMRDSWCRKFDPSRLHELTVAVPEQFVLYPATTWEHKNHRTLLKAVAHLRDSGSPVNLVCTGLTVQPYFNLLLSDIQQLKLGDHVVFTGEISEDQLFALYQRAHAVVVPTMYEAGSFPLMESILLERPVVTSHVTSLPETIGDDRFVFDPTDIRDMADKLRSICFDEQYRAANLAQIKKMQNRLVANRILDDLTPLYNRLVVPRP